ncbi:MAG: radical SAM family heme chaperone HemW [Bacilli bacterium]
MQKLHLVKNNLYIHIPFCSHICSYCDFCKMLYDEQMANKYIFELLKEIDGYNLKSLETVYIGGGTPSSLSLELLELLLKIIQPLLASDYEFTFECNFENTSIDKLVLLKKYGVNRLSFGVQSLDNEILKSLNRYHTKENVIEIISKAKEVGFTNINIDLIYGLPNVDSSKLQKDLEEFIKLDIQHISTYSLTISPNTIFYVKNIKEVDDETSRNLYDLIFKFLEDHGYQRYEVSNFAKKGFESKHNQVYWNNKNYVGVGLGASGYLKDIRYQNTKSMNRYLLGQYIYEKEKVTYKDNINYFLMLKLRTVNGFVINELNEICKEEDFQQIMDSIDRFIQRGLLELRNGFVRCTNEGMMLLDIILRDIFV